MLTYEAGAQQMMLGELKFLEANTHQYFGEKPKDYNAPVEMAFLEDYVPIRERSDVAENRKGAKGAEYRVGRTKEGKEYARAIANAQNRGE